MGETTTYRMMTYRASQPRPNPRAGLLVGAMLTAALTAVFYGAWRTVRLPFVAFDLFDWIIRSSGLSGSSLAARVIELTVAIIGMTIGGTVTGGALFMLFRHCRSRFSMILGVAFGAAAGVLAAFFSRQGSQTTAGTMGPLVWIVGGFVLWGLALGWSYRQQRLSMLREDTDGGRRFMLKLAGATMLVTFVGAACGNFFATESFTRSSAAEPPVDWSLPSKAGIEPAPSLRPEEAPLEERDQVNINMIAAPTPQDWRLEIGGMVQRPKLITLNQLRNNYPALDQMVTSSCTEPPGATPGTQRWTGVSLQRLLPALGAKPGATHVKIRSASGLFEMVSMRAIRSDERVMLTYAWDGVPLPDDRGFPLRIYIPNCFAMKRSKKVESTGTSDRALGYWIERGWDKPVSTKPQG